MTISNPTPGSSPHHRSVNAIVVGGGPCGLAVIGNLLEQHPHDRLPWVDPIFKAGRIGDQYREVPSNTKVELFINFATAIAPFRRIIEFSKEPNAVSVLRKLPQQQGCLLKYAADLCVMLTNGLVRHFDNVEQQYGKVTGAAFNKQTGLWTAVLDDGQRVVAPSLILCTGSKPVVDALPTIKMLPKSPKMMNLDVALNPSLLAKSIKPNGVVGVIGSSHSAILVMMNLFILASTTRPDLRIKWFTRCKDLRYAKYMDGWILHDNTGLKGYVAQWAQEHLNEDVFDKSPTSKVITKFWTTPDLEEEQYEAELPSCTHVIQAIGYKRDTLPELSITASTGANSELLKVQHDDLTGRFFTAPADDSGRRLYLPGLFGAGIAFPECVTDPMGNVERAVGLWKFMKFLKKVVPDWVNSPESV
ncbi:pyridine nucleotide-disulfide oxidoreductase-domain-containing protein [Dactylonectria estremocensis]|uniref:Pyridine nucleotide-disulfide oxidoreductase-domain-containing protein n=1 Tax=Dactylonectria estremocensis TaxID=1079267 RepID=A0A9P9DMN0_9HYPO|nr:pyridine nucleotide-disulfide oxidoreductase-domain-containing protein [Dactylonectria estremocensis]